MDAPAIQYIRTSDGYSIAYAVSGAGRPLVVMPAAIHHVELAWNRGVSLFGPWSHALASRFRLIQFDGRGQGLSTRGMPETLSMDDLLRDLTELMEHLRPGPAVIVGHGATSHVAVNYAIGCPQNVAALVFLSCSAANSAWPAALWRDLASEHWESFALSSGGVSGSHFGPLTRTEMVRRSVTQADWLVRERAYRGSDVSGLLPQLTVPALVLHPRDYFGLSPDESVRLAGLLAVGRLTTIDGDTPYGDPEQGVAAIERFLAGVGLADGPPDKGNARPGREHDVLSARQAEVLALLAAGKTNREIAGALTLSERTVQRHVADIYDRIGARNRAEATAYALKHL